MKKNQELIIRNDNLKGMRVVPSCEMNLAKNCIAVLFTPIRHRYRRSLLRETSRDKNRSRYNRRYRFPSGDEEDGCGVGPTVHFPDSTDACPVGLSEVWIPQRLPAGRTVIPPIRCPWYMELFASLPADGALPECQLSPGDFLVWTQQPHKGGETVALRSLQRRGVFW